MNIYMHNFALNELCPATQFFSEKLCHIITNYIFTKTSPLCLVKMTLFISPHWGLQSPLGTIERIDILPYGLRIPVHMQSTLF